MSRTFLLKVATPSAKLTIGRGLRPSPPRHPSPFSRDPQGSASRAALPSSRRAPGARRPCQSPPDIPTAFPSPSNNTDSTHPTVSRQNHRDLENRRANPPAAKENATPRHVRAPLKKTARAEQKTVGLSERRVAARRRVSILSAASTRTRRPAAASPVFPGALS